jgi:hypothetical protein
MKQARAWLTTWGNNVAEAQYRQHSALIDTVIPKNGGQMCGDGTWAEWTGGLNSPFAKGLKALARRAGQRYVPAVNSGHGDNWREFTTLMENPRLWATSVDNLVTLATVGRADSPWDGVLYDSVTGSTDRYIEPQVAYIEMLAGEVRAAGLSFESTCSSPIPGGTRPKLPLDLFAQVADVTNCVTYFYKWPPAFLNPAWYVDLSIRTALQADIERGRLFIGLPLFSGHWSGEGFTTCTNRAALDLAREAGARIEWVSRDENGPVYEYYADLGDRTYLWLSDGDSLRKRLDLVDLYNIGGVMLFALDYGDAGFWQAIAEWKQPNQSDIHLRGRMIAQKLRGCGGVFSSF